MASLYLVIYSLSVIGALCCGALAAVADVRQMRIPNMFSLFIIISFGAAFICAQRAGLTIFDDLTGHILAALTVFGVTFALYMAGVLGAGDSKLVSAFALWCGFSGLMPFILYTAICGGGLAGLAIFIEQYRPFPHARAGSWLARVQDGERIVPYGVAIFGGALMAFWAIKYHAPFMPTSPDRLN